MEPSGVSTQSSRRSWRSTGTASTCCCGIGKAEIEDAARGAQLCDRAIVMALTVTEPAAAQVERQQAEQAPGWDGRSLQLLRRLGETEGSLFQRGFGAESRNVISPSDSTRGRTMRAPRPARRASRGAASSSSLDRQQCRRRWGHSDRTVSQGTARRAGCAASGSRAADSARISCMWPRRMAFCSMISAESVRARAPAGPAPRGKGKKRERLAGPRAPYELYHSRSTQQARWAPDDEDHGPRQSQLPNRNVRSTECCAVRTLQLTAN